MRHAGFLVLLIVSVMCFRALAFAAGKLPAADAYNERLKTIVDKALHSTLKKHPSLNGITMKIHYAVDRDGHVHNVKVTSRTHDSSAENIVANALASITFPPIPIEAQLEVGAGYFELNAEVTLATDALAVDKAELPNYYNYRMQVHKMMLGDLEASFHASYHLEVDYEFYLDLHGDLTSMKVHAKAGGKRAEQIVARSIRRLKCPPIPPQVFEEVEEKPPLKIFGTMSWDPQTELNIEIAKRTLTHTFFKPGSALFNIIVSDYDSGPRINVVTSNIGNMTKRSFRLSKAQFNKLWANFISSGADKYPWTPDARRFDIEHYYLFEAGGRSYLIPNSKASPALVSIAMQLRAYAK